MVSREEENDALHDEEIGKSYRGLTILRGKRHCKIINEQKEVVFRTTNLRDAEAYLELMEENDRLQRLLDSRGIAPHRIYLLPRDEAQRGRVQMDERVPSSEVVIVAKAEDSVVVRHLEDGREEIVELDELEPIEGGSYLQGPEVTDETVHVLLRFDRETESAHMIAFRTAEQLETVLADWSGEESPGSEYMATAILAEGDLVVYRAEVSIED